MAASSLNLCVKNGTTILGDNLTAFFIGYGGFVLSLMNIAIAVNSKAVFNTKQTLEEVIRELYFHPLRCKVLVGIYYGTSETNRPARKWISFFFLAVLFI